jgi:hypothetical protein
MASRIFEKQKELRPSAMITVAQRRFEDAESLYETGQNARANGVAYLAGFVVEILLKAMLVRYFPSVAKKRWHMVTPSEAEEWRLIWQSHDLLAMMKRLPHLLTSLKAKGTRDGVDYVRELQKVCSEWTIQARYSPRVIPMSEAADLLRRVRVLKELLR